MKHVAPETGPASSGISQAAKHQNTTTVPPMSPRAASTIGTGAMSTMLAPATTEIASAPIDTQYVGSNCAGVIP